MNLNLNYKVLYNMAVIAIMFNNILIDINFPLQFNTLRNEKHNLIIINVFRRFSKKKIISLRFKTNFNINDKFAFMDKQRGRKCFRLELEQRKEECEEEFKFKFAMFNYYFISS